MNLSAPGSPDGDRFDVVTIGETMVQLVPGGDRLHDADALHVGVGGAESNLASYLAAAGHPVRWISAVGDDPFGRRILTEVASYGVDVSRVVVDGSRPTGVYFKDPTPGGGTSVYYYRRGSAASRLSADQVDLPDFAIGRVVHMSGVTMALSAEGRQVVTRLHSRAQKAGAIFSFDVNYRPGLWSVGRASARLLEQARASDLVFVGLDEANTLWGCGSALDVSDLIPRAAIVVKDGHIGATSFAKPTRGERGAGTFVAAPAVDVVEPVGAGDAFAAGYLHAMLFDAPEAARLEAGHRFAGAALRSRHDVAPAESIRAVVSELARGAVLSNENDNH